MRNISFAAASLFALSGCVPSYYPTFSVHSFSGQHINDLRIEEVVTRVKCELHGFFAEFDGHPERIVRPNPAADAVIEMQLKTDETGTLAYQGIDLEKIGLGGLGNLVAQKNGAPLFNTSLAGNYVKTVAMSILLRQTAGGIRGGLGDNLERCSSGAGQAINKLYIKEWLDNFMTQIERAPDTKGGPDGKSAGGVRPEFVSLTTEFHIVVDINVGINRVLLIPTVGSAPTLDFKPNFSHTLKVTLNFNKKAQFLAVRNLL